MTKTVKFDLLTKSLLGDNVLLEAVDVQTNSVIAQPKQYQDKPELGIVLNTGPDVGSVRQEMVVMFNKYLATKFRIDGVDYYVVKEEDIVAYGPQEQ